MSYEALESMNIVGGLDDEKDWGLLRLRIGVAGVKIVVLRGMENQDPLPLNIGELRLPSDNISSE